MPSGKMGVQVLLIITIFQKRKTKERSPVSVSQKFKPSTLGGDWWSEQRVDRTA